MSPFKAKFMKSAGAVTASFLFAGAALASPPIVGSPQYNMGRPYKDFIVKMHNKNGGWCCDLSDGRADMDERIITDADGKTHYQVRVTREAFEYDNAIPPEGRWETIPDEKVLLGEDAERICKPLRDADPNSTCKQPPFNVLWRSSGGYVYCYWPKPQLG